MIHFCGIDSHTQNENMKKLLLIFIGFLIAFSADSQITQTVKGIVKDADTEFPLIGANIEIVLKDGQIAGTSTDLDGKFVLNAIPVGRYTVAISYLGYLTSTLPNVVVNSGKETYLEIALTESVNQLDEVVISGSVDKGESINEMATISAKTFSLEEVTRYSGGRNDASRLVSNFAGVSTADDSRNDIVIRGNSPTGVLWRLEGIPIPNPNHFSTLGTTGGPVSALNTNLLKNSDFMTSAFPAEYGNALSGVFDVGFRSGNKDKYEFTAQLAAFSGLEFMAEGPMTKKGGNSFIVSYRHSFVTIADMLGMDIGTNAIPNYKDITFKFDFGTTKLGTFSLFGIGGLSDISFLGEEIGDDDLFANADADSRAESELGIIGLKHSIILNKRSYLKSIISASHAANIFTEDRYLDENYTDSYRNVDVDDATTRLAFNTFLNTKYSSKMTIRSGVLIERTRLQSDLISRDGNPDFDMDGLPDAFQIRDVDGALVTIQPYSQIKYKFTDNLTANFGLHGQYLDINDDFIIEPRAAINYNISAKSAINLGYGHHSQMQPLPVFFYLIPNENGQYQTLNENLDFTKAHHLVAGYEYRPNSHWKTKVETYYQHLYDVPVDPYASTFSILNAGADFVFPDVGRLVNEGTGRNYGVELTVERFFHNGVYGLLTGSLFESKYTASDNIERNTAFNNQYVLNLLAGKEWKVSNRIKVTTDFKVTTAGGRYYTPIDLEASITSDAEVRNETLAYTEQFDPYFRLDFKMGIRMNSKRGFYQLFALDFQNLTDRENPFTLRYNRSSQSVNTVLQSGFFPDILWRIQF